jgi:hypothetical protein
MNYKSIGLFIVLIVIIIVILMYIYRDRTIHNVIVDDVLFLADDTNYKYSYKLLPESVEGEKYTLSFWVNINNIPENANWDSNVNIPKGIISHFDSPNVTYLVKEDILRVSVGYKDKLSNIEKYHFNLKNFKYQRWENIVVVVDNRSVDIYINGKLDRSGYLPNVPYISNDNLFIGQAGNNFNGHIGLVEYFNDALTISKVKNLYNKNKGKSIFNKKLTTYAQYYKKKMEEKDD